MSLPPPRLSTRRPLHCVNGAAALSCAPRDADVRIVRGIENLESPPGGSVLTVGNFDGVHLAHRRLLDHARALGDRRRLPVIVLTFEPHPLTIVAPQKAPPRLTLPEDKLAAIGERGADITVVARSEIGLLGLEAEAFVRDVLHRQFRPRHLVEGASFGFGRGRKGDTRLLAKLSAELEYELHVVDPVTMTWDDGSTAMVSSSLIRRLLLERDVARAALGLARPYEIVGKVVHGEARGRKLAFPTANLEPFDQLVPGDGVYAGRTRIADKEYRCAVNVGPAPTFADATSRIEAHLLDFEGDLYGQTLRIELHSFLRGQRRFASPGELAEQLRADVAAVGTVVPFTENP